MELILYKKSGISESTIQASVETSMRKAPFGGLRVGERITALYCNY
jgi:hypothetical protein